MASKIQDEANMRLVGIPHEDRWDNRAHFFGAAAEPPTHLA